MTPEAIQNLFTRTDGSYAFARWGRPIVPVVFGLDDAMLPLVKGAVEAVVFLAGHKMAETDPELGANLMLFFFRDWDELLTVPNLAHLVPDLGRLCVTLQAQGAHHYRLFRFDADGAIKAAFVFVRMQGALAEMPARDLMLDEAARMILLWSPSAFSSMSPLARVGQGAILRPQIAAVIQAAYATGMPPVSGDSGHALRLAARVHVALSASGAGSEES